MVLRDLAVVLPVKVPLAHDRATALDAGQTEQPSSPEIDLGPTRETR